MIRFAFQLAALKQMGAKFGVQLSDGHVSVLREDQEIYDNCELIEGTWEGEWLQLNMKEGLCYGVVVYPDKLKFADKRMVIIYPPNYSLENIMAMQTDIVSYQQELDKWKGLNN
jgi:hypothetical protein